MSIKVVVSSADGREEEFHGENVIVDGATLRIFTEPHEIKPGGLVDLFIGDVVALAPGDVARVRRV